MGCEAMARLSQGMQSNGAWNPCQPGYTGEPARLLQGPLADAMTHIGQLALLRRMTGTPVQGENYFVADIALGRVGAEQAAPRRTF